MSMSIQGMHNNALASLHQQRPVRDISQTPDNNIPGSPHATRNTASDVQGSLRNEGVSQVSDDQVIHAQLASLRARQAVSEFHQSENPETAQRSGAMMDNAMRQTVSENHDRTENIDLQVTRFDSRLDAMRAKINEKYTAKIEQMTNRADAAIERATAAGNDERVMHLQERFAAALARLEEKAAEFNARLDVSQERIGGRAVAGDELVSTEIEAQSGGGTASADVAASDVGEGAVSAEDVSDASQTEEEVVA